MDLLIALIVFAAAMIAALVKGVSMVYALLAGLVCFCAVGMHRGFSLAQLARMGVSAVKDSLVVIEVMFVIGFITAAWRVSGTITIFVYYGMKLITPSLFLLITFLLSCLLSYALGTSFGVAGTVGVIFIALARSGGVDPVIAAGAIMSGIYFGDRCSPVSSSANLVAGVTGTKIYDNVAMMMKTGLLPLLLCTILYGVLSVCHPISHVDDDLVQSFETAFTLSPWAFVPAILMLALPLLKVRVIMAMLVSITASVAVACLVQGVPFFAVCKACVFGYQAEGEGLGAILNGGGMVSMLEIIVILLLSGSYSGIFSGTRMLKGLQEKLKRACGRIGRFGVMTLVSLGTVVVFCNQTIATMICADLLKKPYLDEGGTAEELAIDMENTVIVLSGMVPWAIACTVPLAFMDVGTEALLYSFYLILLPVCYGFTKKRWFGKPQEETCR